MWLGRANLFQEILSSDDTKFDGKSLGEYLSGHDVHSAAEAINHFEICLMAVPIDAATRKQLISQFGSSERDLEKRYRQLLHAITSLPEFQLG